MFLYVSVSNVNKVLPVTVTIHSMSLSFLRYGIFTFPKEELKSESLLKFILYIFFHTVQPSRLAQAINLLTCVRKVPGSNIGGDKECLG
jgi:hypothetical protein